MFFYIQLGKCVDTNNDFTDYEGNSCEFYKYDDDCGDYDDDDFQAEKMCCFCGGGYDPLGKYIQRRIKKHREQNIFKI